MRKPGTDPHSKESLRPGNQGPSLRADKWLWAARFFKTRALAVEAITGGRVSVNGDHVKPARELRVGDRLSIRRPPFEHVVVVKALSDKRGPAAVATLLYEETEESRARRTVLAAEMKAMPQPRSKGRPTKKTRRDYERWLRQSDEDGEAGEGSGREPQETGDKG